MFYYDGAREIAEYNSAETTGTLTQAYVWGTQYVDELLMMFGQNGAYFAWQDANWNVIGLTTPGGRLAEEYNYTPYGRVLARRQDHGRSLSPDWWDIFRKMWEDAVCE